jgi:hypothetical protein
LASVFVSVLFKGFPTRRPSMFYPAIKDHLRSNHSHEGTLMNAPTSTTNLLNATSSQASSMERLEPGTHASPQAADRHPPFPSSSKTYLTGSRPDLRVPLREVSLTNGERIALYDTSGPYTDPAATIDVRTGLPALRAAWIESREDTQVCEGRARRPLDDGVKNEAGQGERIAQLQRDAAALQRKPRRALPGANVTQMH